MTQLSIIIVNYRSGGLIADCIRTVLAQTQELSYEIIVVDNDSKDDSEALILQQFPQVRWVQMGYNAGFARANNAGLRIAGGDILLLLNPDTLVLDRALDRCVQRFGPSGYVACGVQLLNPDGSPQITGNYFMKGGLNHLLPLPYWGAFLRWLGYALNTKVPNVREAQTEQEVDWINGAYLMVKRATMEQAGLLDEDFFLYAEEAEWCSRIRRCGRLVVYGDLHVTHLQGETANATFETSDKGYYDLYSRKGLQLMVSNHLRVRKQYGVAWFFVMLLNYTFAVPVFFICSFFHNLFSGRNPFGYWPQAAQLAGNVARLWALTPRIVRNKPYFYKVL
jgi:GT2 family glycosyltransferase